MKISRRVVLFGLGGAAVLAAVVGVVATIARANAPANGGSDPSYREATIATGDLRETVSATGPVEAHQRSNMSFLLSNPVGQVNVTEGQSVRAGDTLISLDTSTYALDIASAQLALEAQKIAFNQLVQPPDKYDVAAARSAVARSASLLAQLKEEPNGDMVRLAQQNLELQRDTLYKVQLQRDAIKFLVDNPRYNRGQVGDTTLHDITRDVVAAELAVEIAKQQLIDAQQGVSSHDIAAAQASLAQSLSTLNRILEGPTSTDLELVRLQIQQSELSVSSAQSVLDNAILTAPFDGIIGEVNYDPGEQAVPGQIALVLLDDSSFHVDVLIDEVDIARVSEGQLAFVSLDAYPGQQISAHVVSVAPDAVMSNGVVSYEVRVELDGTDIAVHDGMTATVDIVVSELTGVLLVPNWAVRYDRQSGQAFASVRRPDHTIEEVEIEIGQRGETVSEVRSGLGEVDVVVVSIEAQSQ